MKLSIVIVSWNTADILAQCLDSVYAPAPEVSFEVWVVDNASTDGSAVMVQQRYPQVNLLINETNVGFATANNQAIRRCTGDYVLLLNPDTIVHAGALSTLTHFLDQNPAAGACGARLLNPDGSLQLSSYPAPTLGRELLRMFHLDGRIRYHMDQWDTNKPHMVESLLGACILARRPILESIGFMDETYFMFSEEIDLCYRIRQADWHIYWVPQAQIVHLGGQSTRQVKTEMFLRLYEGKLRYMRKHYGRFQATLYKLVLLVASLARVLLAPIAWLERPPRRDDHLALVGRYWKLVRALPGF